MPTIMEDSILWYNVPGPFAEAGLAVPNWGNDIGTFNGRIFEIVDLLQTRLQYIMFHRDADIDTSPDIGLLRDIHKLYLRISGILNAYAIPYNEEKFKPIHNTPAGHMWRVHPVPYFKIENRFLRTLAENILGLVTELMQHTENATPMDISLRVKDICANYLNRVYNDMAIKFFKKTATDVNTPDFLLVEADFIAYDPPSFETDMERMQTVPLFDYVFTEDQVRPLRKGILVDELPDLGPHPTSLKRAATSRTQNPVTPQQTGLN